MQVYLVVPTHLVTLDTCPPMGLIFVLLCICMSSDVGCWFTLHMYIEI